MTNEEKERKEIYLNEILASEDIHKLKEEKVITNCEKIEIKKDFEFGRGLDNKLNRELPDNFKENDNLLIKGNNLMALYSLKKIFKGKVKLIYIDPPYNTGNDSFKYNDNFNHSTWLVFMKNRLEVAKELLREDGIIFISINDNEQAYLKVLMDEIFGRDNFLAQITWKQFHSVKNDAKYFSSNTESILCFCKIKSDNLIKNEKYDKSLNYPFDDNDGRGKYKLDPIYTKSGNKTYEYTFKNGMKWKSPNGTYPRYSKENLYKMEEENKIVLKGKNPMAKRYLNEVSQGLKVSTFWDGKDVGYSMTGDSEIKTCFGGIKIFKNPKPEKLLKRIIEISTEPGDIVLDFFAGSGTTGAVAHKLNRQWILVEQLDYIETITKVRLEKVLLGETGGISKEIDFKGGGSFIYLELKTYNEKYRQAIKRTNTKQELLNLIEEMKKNALCSWRYQFDAIKSIKDDNSSLEDLQKIIIGEILDKNMYYVPKSEMEDNIYKVSEEDKDLTRKFYERKK